jgi:hypothetical protein
MKKNFWKIRIRTAEPRLPSSGGVLRKFQILNIILKKPKRFFIAKTQRVTAWKELGVLLTFAYFLFAFVILVFSYHRVNGERLVATVS